MLHRYKYAITIFLTVALMAAAVVFAEINNQARVEFSGITLVSNTNNAYGAVTTQGYVDITLKNIDTTGLCFCLEYDTRYIKLSDVSNNEAIKNPTSNSFLGNYDTEHKFLQQNTDVFPDGCFQDDTSVAGNYWKMLGVADPNNGKVMMNFIPDPSYISTNDAINSVEANTGYQNTIMAGKKDLVLGRLSFVVENPIDLINLSQSDIDNLIKVVPFKTMIPFIGEDGDTDVGVSLAYIDENKDVVTYSHAENHIDYDIKIKTDIEKITPQNSAMSTNAFEIYNSGTQDDLITYLNERASIVTLHYTDRSQVPQVIDWTGATISGPNWDAKCPKNTMGTPREYTVTKTFENKFPVSVTVSIEPVSVKEYKVENENITYLMGAEDFPQTIGDLNLPETAEVVLEPYLLDCSVEDVDLTMYILQGGAAALSDSDPVPAGFATLGGVFRFSGFPKSDYGNAYPWLTIPTGLLVEVARNSVTDEQDMPKEIECVSSDIDDDGKLTVTIKNTDNTAIPSGSMFKIKLPGGELLNESRVLFNAEINADGTATITVQADIEGDEYNKRVAQLINLGKRAGTYEIAYIAPGAISVCSNYAPFEPEPRVNYYLPYNYVYDFTGDYAPMMPIKAMTANDIPTTITIPALTDATPAPTMPPATALPTSTPAVGGLPELRMSDSIFTTYDGYTGSEPGKLKTINVYYWSVIDGDPNTVGSTVHIEGPIADADYTNYGRVINSYNAPIVSIYYVVQGKDNDDEIGNISHFEFDTKTVGYKDLQKHTVTIVNTGQTDIYGLSANIEISTESESEDEIEAFLLTQVPIQLLEKGKSTQLEITPKKGLPVGTYTSKVTISSNNGGILKEFNVKFKVTNEKMYKINLTVKDDNAATPSKTSDMGSVKTSSGTYTAAEGETITIVATPSDPNDYSFEKWIIDDDSNVTLSDNTATATFTMPANDVDIQAEFREKAGAKLRLDELYVMDTDVTDETSPSGYQLYKKLDTGAWQTTTYEKTNREYYVAVPNNKEEVKVWFKPRDEAEAATIEVTYTDNVMPTPTVIPNGKAAGEKYYKTDDIALVVAPTENTVVLSMELDDPTEGTVTKEYTLHIFRKIADGDKVTFKYGNSPLGLIMNDGSKSDKTTELTNFINNDYTFTALTVPENGQAGIRYGPEAWGSMISGTLSGKNYDTEDEFALFVNKNETFKDPGYSDGTLKNSLGDTVTTGVTKKISQVKVLRSTVGDTPTISDFRGANKEDITITDSGLELDGKRILPDIYKLKYEYTDFDGSTTSVEKSIIILAEIGDYNLDNSTSPFDVDMALNRFINNLADYKTLDYEAGGRIYKYRVCDVNKDSHVNAIDANYIRASSSGFQLTNFYQNMQGGGS